MAYRVVETKHFTVKLRELLRSRVRSSGIKSVEKLFHTYKKVLKLLTGTPRYGTPLEDSRLGRECRWIPLERYIAIYSIDEEVNNVFLINIFYPSENWREKI